MKHNTEYFLKKITFFSIVILTIFFYIMYSNTNMNPKISNITKEIKELKENKIDKASTENQFKPVSSDIYILAKSKKPEDIVKLINYHKEGLSIATMMYYTILTENMQDTNEDLYISLIREGLQGSLSNEEYFFESIVYLSVLESRDRMTIEEKILLSEFRKRKFI